jgi:hypothetical protein
VVCVVYVTGMSVCVLDCRNKVCVGVCESIGVFMCLCLTQRYILFRSTFFFFFFYIYSKQTSNRETKAEITVSGFLYTWFFFLFNS